MIYDTIDRLAFYEPLLPGTALIKSFLEREDLAELKNGKYELDGDNLYASIDSYFTHPIDVSRFEAHQRYADLQILIDGHHSFEKGKNTLSEKCGDRELCGVSSPSSLLTITTAYDAEKDILFGQATNAGWVNITRTHFAVFFPNDAHLPGCHPLGRILPPVRKCVFKIKI